MIYFKEQLAEVAMCFGFMFELYLFPMKPEKYLRKPFYSLFKPYLDSVYWVVVYHERLLYTYPFGWLDNRHADWLVLVCDLVLGVGSGRLGLLILIRSPVGVTCTLHISCWRQLMEIFT